MSTDDVAIIFPEGTRASAAKRERALASIAERDPDRAERLAGCGTSCLRDPPAPPRCSAGAPESDVVIAWHTGFEGLDTFGGILRALAPRRATHPLRRDPDPARPT